MLFLTSSTMVTSLLNVVSHGAVLLGALNDTYVLSILFGVGFDVITRLLQFVWWVQWTWIIVLQQQEEEKEGRTGSHEDALATRAVDTIIRPTILFILIIGVTHLYQLMVHLQALRMNYSLDRLTSVLQGALNNLRGVAGDGYRDHLFAYVDFGEHVLHCKWSLALLLQGQQHHYYQCWGMTVCILLTLIILSYLALSRIPFSNIQTHNTDSTVSLLHIGEDRKVICSCDVCKKRTEKKGESSCKGVGCSFTFTMEEGICCLWLCSFETLSTFLCSAKLLKKVE